MLTTAVRREIMDSRGFSCALSAEVYLTQHPEGMPACSRAGTQVQLISGVDGKKTPGYHFAPGWVTVCRLDAAVAEFIGIKRENIVELSIAAGNKFHRFINMLPVWQKEYIQELKRTSGQDAGFESRAGGWYGLKIEGALPSKLRRRQIMAMTAALRAQPNLVKE